MSAAQKRRIQIEDETLLENRDSSKLTSDLPSRSGKKRGRPKFLLPILIIVAAGIIGFIIPTITSGPNEISRTQGEGDILQIIEEDKTAAPQEVFINKTFAVVNPNEVGFLNVRAEPSTAGAKLGQLDIGDKVEILVDQTDWVKVKLDKPLSGATEGWVSAGYIERVVERVKVE